MAQEDTKDNEKKQDDDSSSSGGGNRQHRRSHQNRYHQRRPYFSRRRRVCPIKLEDIHWKNIDGLRYFLGDNGEIRPRRKTGATAKQQRRAAQAIKRARFMALLPYTNEHIRITRKRRASS